MNRKLPTLALTAFAAFAAFSAFPSSTRTPAIAILRVPNSGIQPQAVMDNDGVLHLLYFAGDPKAGDLYYVTSSNNGAAWSAPLRVNSVPRSAIALGTIRGGQMAIDGKGRAHVAWNGATSGQGAAQPQGPLNPESGQRGAPMLYSRMNESRTAFEPERNLMTRTFGLDGGGTVAADSAGNVYVAWHGKTPGAPAGEAGRQVWVAESHDGGANFAPEQPAWNQPSGACGCCGMAMFADSRGAVRALFRSATEGVHRDIYLLTSFDHGRTFDGRKLHTWNINACPMSSMSLAEGAGAAAGKIAGAWETGGQVYFENLTGSNSPPAGAPGAPPVSAPGEGKNRKHPRLAIAANGQMLMVWTEGTGWQRGGSLAWQLYDPAGKPIGETATRPGIPAWSFAAVAAGPRGFVIVY